MKAEIIANIEKAAAIIGESDGLIIAVGAGMGVDSGLPDFRGRQGFWRAYPALADSGLDFTEIANPAAFQTNPRLAWGFYGHRLNLYRNTEPHQGFKVLKNIAVRMLNGYQVFTSNVDGQFQKANFYISNIAECHGSIHYLQCTAPCSDQIWSAETLRVHTDVKQCLALGDLPSCMDCGSIARPNILMFGDAQWVSRRTDRQMQLLSRNISSMKRPVVIEIGAGKRVPTVRYFSEHQVVGGRLIRINPTDADGPKGAISIYLGALEALQLIEKQLKLLNYFR